MMASLKREIPDQVYQTLEWRSPMNDKALHQDTSIFVSHTLYSRKAHQARSDALAKIFTALGWSIREILLACNNRLKVHA
jgi:hypothetical protein